VDATQAQPAPQPSGPPRIQFAAIGLNHGHIYGQCEAVTRGGGQLVKFYATEPDLIAQFQKRYPSVALARSEQEILDDAKIKLVVSAAIAFWSSAVPFGRISLEAASGFAATHSAASL